MPTNYLVRILLLAPSARQNAINTWVRNNLDAAGANWLSVGLNTTGSGAATFYWFNAALTVPNFRLIAAQLLQMSSIALPGNFDSIWIEGD
jgi:hypothetical protein